MARDTAITGIQGIMGIILIGITVAIRITGVTITLDRHTIAATRFTDVTSIILITIIKLTGPCKA